MEKIIIFGGDGFCGWPLSLKLSHDYEIHIVDDLSRREIDKELGVDSIVPIHSISERIKKWYEITNKKIFFHKMNIVNDIKKLENLFIKDNPYAVVMLAELKSAPYSLKSLKHGNKTIHNNLISNHNLLNIISSKCPSCHFVHLGTMGVYGYDYSNKLLPDGYYDAVLTNHVGDKIEKKLLHPASPGSIYHLTKAQEEIMFQYFQKIYQLKITDLHQGIVWGVNTNDTVMDEVLFNRFDYDGDYGTVLNRFIVQTAIGYPLTVHGSGNQIRPLININNSVEAIKLVIDNPPINEEKVRIYNQLAETFRISDIANKLKKNYSVNIDNQVNPRIEDENNNLKAKPIGLLELGLKPIYFDHNKIQEMVNLAKRFSNRINKDKIKSITSWKLK